MGENMQQVLGFVGVGRMGYPIAARLLSAGFELVVCDRDAQAVERLCAQGATAAADPAQVAEKSDIVTICLPSPEIVREVALGERGVVNADRFTCLIDISTTGTKVAREIEAALQAKGKLFVDCPMTGGVDGAKTGKLSMISSGAPDALAAARHVLEIIGNKLVVAGLRAGDGQMLKVLNNTLSFIALETTAEVMALGARYGLDGDVMLDLFNSGTGRNSATMEKFPRSVMPRSFDFGFPVRGVNKDMGLCLDEAEALGVPMPVATMARQIWMAAMAEMADDDMTSIVKLFERWAGTQVRGAASGSPVEQERGAADLS